MDINNYFIKDKRKTTDQVFNAYSILENNVQELIEIDRPILNGNIDLYSKFVDGKNLQYHPKTIENVMKEFSDLFKRAVVWENKGTMINITPPANIASIAASFYTALYNPNFAQDESSGYLMATELIVSKYLDQLVNWDFSKSRGIFTFGGKGTNLYAVKIGLLKAIKDVTEKGIGNQKAVVISNDKSHPCHAEVCDWLGLGKEACLKIKTDENGQVLISQLEKTLREELDNGNKVACIILNGGTTNEVLIDPIKAVVDLRDALVQEYKLDYIPHIHVDAVIGWAWLFFKEYDFVKNPLKMSDAELKKIKSITSKIEQLEYADSFGADFHKTGFCPYISSIFMIKNYNDLTMLGNKKDKGIQSLSFGEYSPFEYTLELTRSSIGPVSAYIALESFGIEGFQELIYRVFSNSEYIRGEIDKNENFEVINKETEGIATLFVIKKDKEKRYLDYLTCSKDEINNFINFNYQFYLYCLKSFEEKKVNFKITFSKSYKPYGSAHKTGALKIYPTSPVTTKKELDDIIKEIFLIRDEYEKENILLKDSREVPIDYVYRD